MATVDRRLDSGTAGYITEIHERLDALEAESEVDADGLDDDQLARLGIENVVPDEPTIITLPTNDTTGANWTLMDTVQGSVTASHDFPELQVNGQARITGEATFDNDLTVHGFTSIGDMVATTIHAQDAVVGGLNILSELAVLRGQMDVMRLERDEMNEILRRLTEANGQNES